MTVQKEKIFPSWEEIHQKSFALAEKIIKTGKPYQGIIAVTRGGMVPACLIAQKLNLKRIQSFGIESYQSQTQNEASLLNIPEIPESGKDWIVIDDLSDTGKTFQIIRTHFPKALYTCLYVKPEGEKQADLFRDRVDQTCWIHFPWEPESELRVKSESALSR